MNPGDLYHQLGVGEQIFDKPISTGPVEGINNKIKTLKLMAYGFRDDGYFTLRFFALHDFKFS